jgi:hypothetical protein
VLSGAGGFFVQDRLRRKRRRNIKDQTSTFKEASSSNSIFVEEKSVWEIEVEIWCFFDV